MRNIIIIIYILTFTSLSACSWVPDLSGIGLPRVHKVDVQQGNVIEQDSINQLRPGMSKDQVRFVMGTPMLNNVFHKDRWDYLYRSKPGYGAIETKQATLYFNKDGKLTNIQGSFRPGDKAENVRSLTDVHVVPLENYEDDGDNTSYWQRFVSVFSWSDDDSDNDVE